MKKSTHETSFEEDLETVRKYREIRKARDKGLKKTVFEHGILKGETRLSDGTVMKYEVDHNNPQPNLPEDESELFFQEPEEIRFNLGSRVDRNGRLPGEPGYKDSGEW